MLCIACMIRFFTNFYCVSLPVLQQDFSVFTATVNDGLTRVGQSLDCLLHKTQPFTLLQDRFFLLFQVIILPPSAVLLFVSSPVDEESQCVSLFTNQTPMSLSRPDIMHPRVSLVANR